MAVEKRGGGGKRGCGMGRRGSGGEGRSGRTWGEGGSGGTGAVRGRLVRIVIIYTIYSICRYFILKKIDYIKNKKTKINYERLQSILRGRLP